MKNIFHRESTITSTAKVRLSHPRKSNLRLERTRGKSSVRLLVAVFAVLLAGASGIFFYTKFAQAATYNFTQSSWIGGATANTAVHATNQSGWTQYTSQTGLAVTTDIQISPVYYKFTDDGATSTTPAAPSTGGGFGNGTLASTVVTGTGAAASVTLGSTATVGTGGTISYSGTKAIHTFTTSGTFTPAQSGTVDYLVVAGGGAGGGGVTYGNAGGGGGGGGGVKYGTSTAVTAATPITITVGAGGTGGPNKGVNGGDSAFGAVVATGGGGGGGGNSAALNSGANGGSGGGAVNSGAAGTPGTGVAGQGNVGGYYSTTLAGGGGGGGAGAPGNLLAAGASANEGAGGAGIANTITGATAYYGGGGGGGAQNNSCVSVAGAGGIGGGAAGTSGGQPAAATPNTGGGGGGYGYCTASGMTNGGSGGSGVVIVSEPAGQYLPSGTFTSAVIDLGAPADFGVHGSAGVGGGTTGYMYITVNEPVGAGISLDVRGSQDNVTWTAYTANYSTFWHNGTPSQYAFQLSPTLQGSRYFQYRVNFTTTDPTVTASLNDVWINYAQYGNGSLISSKYDSGAATNIISKLIWTATGTTTSSTIKFQERSSADGVTWSNWCGPSIACLGTDYFQDADNGVALPSNHPLKIGGNDRYLQYQVFLAGGATTPVLTSVTAQYVVNAAPDFDATYGTNGVIASQMATSTDPNWGKVPISYRVRDIDTTTGSATPGFVTPSFEYSTNSGGTWVAIPAADLLPADVTNKAVNGSTYTTYTALWNASSTLPSVYSTTMKVRVTVNDNEGANNTAQAISGLFTLDTASPAVAAGNANLDSSTGAATGSLIITATDNSQMQYRACNDNTFPGVDAQSNSCAWSALGGNLASTTITWTTFGTPGTETVYLQLRDALGNTTARTIVAPATPNNFVYKDITNTAINAYWEFLSWGVFANTTGSAFSAYKLYSSIDGTNFTPLATITDPALNYYRDNITVATTSMHYYKMTVIDTDGDVAHYTPTLSDIPNGTGGTDTTPPTVSAVAVPAGNLKNTSAQITFTTDKLAQATAQYRVNGTLPWTTVSNVSYLTAQTMYITGLAPNTLYNLQVKATDAWGNVSGYVAGPNFTTAGGPVITNTTVSSLSDISATIFWNTNVASDSYVYYSTSASLANPSTAGSAALVSCVASICQHQVTVSGLTAGRQYYYYVKSTDALANATTDTNTNNYYSFTTTLDTTPPVISAISTPVMASNEAIVVWKTDELATSQVLYGTTSGDTSKFTATDVTKSIYHVVTLSGQTVNAGVAGGFNALTPVTKYYYVVRSSDIAGNTATSPEQTFTTPNTGDVTIVAVSVVNTITGAGGATLDTIPPVISGIKATAIDSFSEAISFTTNEDALTFIDYGKDTSYGDNVGHPVLTMNHNIRLPNLSMGTTYHFRIKAIDKSGNMTTADDQTFKTPFLSEQTSTTTVPLDDSTLLQTKIEDLVQSALPSLTAPFVTTPIVTNITEHGAKINWETNVKAYGLLGYVSDAEYKENVYAAKLSSGTDRLTAHEVILKDLKSNTKYHIQASGYVFQQVVGKSNDITFSTKPAQIVGSITERKKDSFTVAWTTDEPTTSIVEYKDTVSGVTQRNTDAVMRTAHSLRIENLPSGTTYTVSISGINSIGNTVEAVAPLTVTTSRDITPPVISGFKVDGTLVPGRTDRIQTVVSWKTDEPADAVVYYEEGAGTPGDTKELANKVALPDNFITNHSVILASLKPGTIYRLKITSADDSGNVASFGPRTIITPQQTQSITDIIFKNFEDSFKFLRKI